MYVRLHITKKALACQHPMKLPDSTIPKGATKKYRVIHFTDLQLHSRMRVTPSIGKRIQQAFQENIPGRIYAPLPKPTPEEVKTGTLTFTMDIDPELRKMIQQNEAEGYETIFSLPEGGAPVYLGDDTHQFLESKNGKRILRELDKKNNENKL